jgi:translation initiation factor IF-1
MRSTRFAVVLIAVLVAMGSYAAGAAVQTPPPPSSLPADRAALEAAVRAYSAAFLANDVATAYAVLSEDCQEELSRAEFRRIVNPVARRYGDAELVSFKITKYSDERARVTYRYDKRAIDVKKEPWVYEDGVWRRGC